MGSARTAGTADGRLDTGLETDAIEYAREVRGISRATLERIGARSGTHYFPGRLGRRSRAVVFPYRAGGKVVNWKACAFPEKDFIGAKGGKLAFWNLDAVLEGIDRHGDVYIVEGEWDAASLVEAGIPPECVTSVPNGAQDRVDPENPKGYEFVDEALAAGLNRARRFIWCGDVDDAGRLLRQVMVKLLGAARFWFVDWPEGAKDANDFLRSDGPDALRDLAINGALPWPTDGLYRMSELPEPPALTLWEPGFPEWDGRVMLAPGTMSVVIGHGGHGKTALWRQIWHNIARQYDAVIAVATFETRAKPHHRRVHRELYAGVPERDMHPDYRRKADEWIEEHFLWMEHPERRPTVEWLLDMAEIAVVRHGAKVIQLDPWNRMEHARQGRETETEYIGRCIRAMYDFALDMGVHFQVLCHPAKVDSKQRGREPSLEDASGSKAWETMVDQGFIVHRPHMIEEDRSTESKLIHAKVRIDELGRPCRLNLRFNPRTGSFVSTDGETYAEAVLNGSKPKKDGA